MRNISTPVTIEQITEMSPRLKAILIGYLILRSSFLPRIIGAFLLIAGLSYQIDSLANLLSLPLATYSFRDIAMPAGGLGEGPPMLWLLLMGVNPQRWKEQASAVGGGA